MTLPDGRPGFPSEIADAYVKDINEHVKKTDKVRVKVLSVDIGQDWIEHKTG